MDPTDNWLLLHATVCWDKREEWKPRQTDVAEKMHTRPQAQLRNALNTIDCRVVLQRKSNTVWFVSVVLSATYHRWKSADIIQHFLLSLWVQSSRSFPPSPYAILALYPGPCHGDSSFLIWKIYPALLSLFACHSIDFKFGYSFIMAMASPIQLCPWNVSK